ncbi:homogentisate 1,2-dioxygenase [Actinocorallia herbida]|uniref:Homogentisate 1,2-dioxygenase n=1 Tax=Actinocorallia herbida TaxID=58109 RepID=A0A3N1CPF2_9ACTN|nr:cupin domain-containing protein [Actinocorallia herbida]ROO83075.1 homogentisate 1,2-dioxygenase [Actinocorallia herbida]
MAHYRSVGNVPPKRHTQHRTPEGGLYYEELMGEEGFFSDSSLLYHRGLPSALSDARPWTPPGGPVRANLPLLPRHLRPHELFGADDWRETDAVTGRRVLLANADVRICYVVAGSPSPLFRDAVGDECVYIESGAGTLETVFGALPFRQGDYVLIPRGTAHRWVPGGGQPVRAYCVEASSHITPVRRYLSKYGQFLEHAPYCERDLHGPSEPLLADSSGEVELLVKHRGPEGVDGTSYLLPHHPFDVVGWDGCLYPYTFNVADFEPITGRIHQPPPVHQVFEGSGFVICNFVPRKVDYHPLSIPVPYYHSNVDSDEVMFYCGGDYAARKGSGIAQGSISLHPGGHTHGPQPGAYERSIGAESFDELAVMVDTFRPLDLGEAAFSCQDPAYPWTWSRPPA